jgi:hypothetical protein
MSDPFENSDAATPEHAKLAEALAGLYNERVLVPPALDEALYARAQTHLQDAARRRAPRLKQRLGLAAAALIMLAAVLARLILPSAAPSRIAREDIDRNGRVDILDAFALARQVERKEKIDARFDFNGDGVIDRKDIDFIGAKAVTLDRKRG